MGTAFSALITAIAAFFVTPVGQAAAVTAVDAGAAVATAAAVKIEQETTTK